MEVLHIKHNLLEVCKLLVGQSRSNHEQSVTFTFGDTTPCTKYAQDHTLCSRPRWGLISMCTFFGGLADWKLRPGLLALSLEA